MAVDASRRCVGPVDRRLDGPFGLSTPSKQIEYSLPVIKGNAVTRLMSPYDYGAFYKNPLKDIVEKFNYDRVCDSHAPLFYVGATRVRNGKIRILRGMRSALMH